MNIIFSEQFIKEMFAYMDMNRYCNRMAYNKK